MSTSSTKSIQQSSSRTAKSSSSGGGGGGGLTRETYGKLNVSAIESATQLWLAQLPAALATAIDAAPEGAFLGTLTFTKGGLVSSSTSPNKTSERVAQKLSLQMSPQLEESLQMKKSASSSSVDVLPLDYTLTNITKQSSECVMHPFTRHPTNGSVELHGSVVRTLTVQMERTERYRDMCKARIYNETMMGGGGGSSSNSYSNPNGSNGVGGDKQQRFVQSIDTIHSLAKVDALQSSNAVKTAMSGGGGGGAGGTKTSAQNGGGFGNSVAQFGKRLREAQQQQLLTSSSSTLATGTSSRKRPFTFTSESSVRTILFELFSQQSHWPLKDLRAACGGFKTDKEIRTELTLIGEYQRTGQLKGLWELKAEFKDNIHVAKDESATGDMGNN